MAGYRYFVCPVEFNNDSNSFQVDCEPSELFQLQDYVLPSILESATGWVRSSCFLFLILPTPLPETSDKELCDLACFCVLANTVSPPPQTTVRLYPFQIHSIALSSFASIVGPFGGFFASGFKRAFKIKVAGKQTFCLDQWLFQTKDHLTQKYTLVDHLTHLAKYPQNNMLSNNRLHDRCIRKYTVKGNL